MFSSEALLPRMALFYLVEGEGPTGQFPQWKG